MIKQFYTLMLVSLLAIGCGKNELDNIPTENEDSSGQISFGTGGADWTRGKNISDTDDIPSLTVYSYYANYAATAADVTSWDDVTADDLLPLFTSDINTPFTLTNNGYGLGISDSWSYTGGKQYWPWEDDEKLSFIALYPQEELTLTPNEDSGKPEFSYTMSELANENDDIVIDGKFDMTEDDSSNGCVDFGLEHALTKLTLKVNYSGELDELDRLGADGTDEIFVVNGISFSGLYNNGTLNINSDGTMTWTQDETNTIEVTAAQGNTIVPIYTYDESGNVSGINPNAILSTTSKSVMETDEAIFVLPQQLDTERTSPPKAKVRIRRLYFTDEDVANGNTTNPSGEMLYSTTEITIPSAENSDGWVQGEHNVLSFTFELDNLTSYVIPMTLISEIYDWTDIDVNVTVHPNIYIYSSDSDLELTSTETTADMYIYTNYTYDLRRHKRNIELDGSSTEAAGFTFYTSSGTCCEPLLVFDGTDYYYVYDDENNLYISTDNSYSEDDTKIEQEDGIADLSPYEVDGWLTFKIKPIEGYEAADFTYQALKTTRDDLGLYTNSSIEDDFYGINKSGDDAVYILQLNVNNDHLMNEEGDDYANTTTDDYGYFTGSIGAEMLSNGGGKITYKFDVSLKKAFN